MNNNIRSIGSMTGSSVTEFIVVMAVFVPTLLLVASFTGLLSFSNAATQAGRLAAWQRTIYQPNEFFTEAQVTQNIQNNIGRLYAQRNHLDFAKGNANGAGYQNLVDVDTGAAMSMETETGQQFGNIANANTSLARRINCSLNRGSSSCFGFGQIDAATMISPVVSLPLQNQSSLFQLITANNFRESNYQQVAPPEDNTPGVIENRFHIKSHAALLTAGSWGASTPEQFQDTVETASFQRELKKFQNPNLTSSANFVGTFWNFILGLKEMELPRTDEGLSVVPLEQADILPE